MANEPYEIRKRDAHPVPVKDYYNAREVARLLQISRDRVYELARYPGDPLPLRCLRGVARGAVIHRDDLREWVERNTILFSDREARR